MSTLEGLPVELISHCLGFITLEYLILVASLSKRLRAVVSSDCNPWHRPMRENLESGKYESCLRTLSVRTIVPRSTFLPLLVTGRSRFLLFDFILPNLSESDWKECFRGRFLPGWRHNPEERWRMAHLACLQMVYHRTHTSCTAQDAWTRYIILNRKGTANRLECTSRSFNPQAIFNEMKLEQNLGHLETRIRVIVELTDVRILAFGVLHRPRSSFMVNSLAHSFLRPPGLLINDTPPTRGQAEHDVLQYPLPAVGFRNYPYHTPGLEDQRWGDEEDDLEGVHWVGGMLIVAQLVGPRTSEKVAEDSLVAGPGRSQYTSLSWDDLWTIAPWLQDTITNKIDGPGLGL